MIPWSHNLEGVDLEHMSSEERELNREEVDLRHMTVGAYVKTIYLNLGGETVPSTSPYLIAGRLCVGLGRSHTLTHRCTDGGICRRVYD